MLCCSSVGRDSLILKRRFSVILLLALLLNGCASFMSRDDYWNPDGPSAVYPGTYFWFAQWAPSDLKLIEFPLWLGIRIISVIDLPFTLTADTILLPWDLASWSSGPPTSKD